MSNENRYGDDRYRQDDYRSEADRRDGPYGDGQARGYGPRGGQDGYHGGGEDRSFGQGADGGYGEEAYRNRQYGQGQYGPSRTGGDRDPRYSNRQAATSGLHQGYRAPFGDRDGFDRNDFHAYATGAEDGQRYQYNNYAPVHDTAGRYAHGVDGRAGPEPERGFWDQTRDTVSSWFGDEHAARRRKIDEIRAHQNGEHHGGRGPKNYTRSDERIREDLNDRLTDDYRLDASDIEVKVAEGEITLSGHVASRYDKRRAEDIAEQVGGAKHVQNNLRVKDATTSSAYSTATANTGATGPSTATGSTTANRSN